MVIEDAEDIWRIRSIKVDDFLEWKSLDKTQENVDAKADNIVFDA